MTGLHPQQEEQPPPPKKKRPRSLKSCLSCRRAKQRCEVVPPAAEEGRGLGQGFQHHQRPAFASASASLACRRCQILDLQCTITAPPEQKQQKQQKQQQPSTSTSTPSASSTGSTTTPSVRKAKRLPAALEDDKASVLRGIGTAPPPASLPPSSSSAHGTNSSAAVHPRYDVPRLPPEPSGSRPAKRRTYLPAPHDMQRLDPIPLISQASDPRAGNLPGLDSLDLLTGMSWLERARMACRPIRLLDHLLAVSVRPTKSKAEAAGISAGHHGTLAEIMEALFCVPNSHACYKEEIFTLQHFMPFLPSFTELLHSEPHAQFLLATCMTLTPAVEDKSTLPLLESLMKEIEKRALACMLRPSHAVYDNYAVTIVALYHPQILSNLVTTGSSIDGAGFLAASAHAARMMGFEKIFAQVENAVKMGPRLTSTSSTIRMAVFWLYLGFRCTLNSLATSIDGQPAVPLQYQEIRQLKRICEVAIQDVSVGHDEKYAWSCILLLTFRAESTRMIHEACARLIHGFKGRSDPSERALRISALLNVTVRADEDLEEVIRQLVTEMKRVCIFLEAHQVYDEAAINWIELEIAISRFLCLSQFTDQMYVRAVEFVGQCSSSSQFLSRLLREPVLMRAYERTGGRRAIVARHVLTLVANFTRISTPSTNRIMQGISIVLWCSVIVMACKSIAEEIACRYLAGDLSVGLLGSGSMESGLLLLYNAYDSLCNLILTRRNCSEWEEHLIMTAAKAVQGTSTALLDWKARVTGLTGSQRSGPHANEAANFTAGTHHVNVHDAFLHDILAMPTNSGFEDYSARLRYETE